MDAHAPTEQSQNLGLNVAALQQQTAQIRKLAARDREVRAHEQAHAAVGGQHASHPHYNLERGPNGVSYAVSGHVNIDVSEVPGDPQATLEKMQQVQRAAMAPANPSAADRAVAAKAAQAATQARAEMLQEKSVDVSDAEGTKGAVIDVFL